MRRVPGWHRARRLQRGPLHGDARAAGRVREAEDALRRSEFDSGLPFIARATAVSLLPSNPGPCTVEGIERASRATSVLVCWSAAAAPEVFQSAET